MSKRPLIEAHGLGYRTGGHELLHHIDLTVAESEIVTLIGPNGAGKSTLVKLLLGLLRPSTGVIQRRPDLTVGYLPQHFPVDPVMPLTVRRLLTLTGRPDPAAITEGLTRVGIRHLVDAPLPTLSGGERQRALLARALLRRPDLLVLDEPTQGVDFTGEAALYRLIAELRDRDGFGVLMVSHDLHLVMAATDRVVCLNRHVCCAGAPESVRRHPEYLALFEPEVAGAMAVYAHHHDHDHDLAGGVVSGTDHPGDGGA